MQCSDICGFAPYFFEGNFIGGNFILYFGYISLVKTRLITYHFKAPNMVAKNVIDQCEFSNNVGTLLVIYNNSSNGIVKKQLEQHNIKWEHMIKKFIST
jgi:hypothetical protein